LYYVQCEDKQCVLYMTYIWRLTMAFTGWMLWVWVGKIIRSKFLEMKIKRFIQKS